MSKKDFISLANVIKENPEHFSPMGIDRLADWLRQTAPRFNRDLWHSYIRGECGPCGGKVKP